METIDFKEHAHRRMNILTGEWVLVSPHRTKRPWQGKMEALPADNRPQYDPNCYLCPGNKRADGSLNETYTEPFVFTNDFSALLHDTPKGSYNLNDLLIAKTEKGICRVISFSPRHDLTLPNMSEIDIKKVIDLWQKEFKNLAANPFIKYIQIFENKGDIMVVATPTLTDKYGLPANYP